MQATTFVDAGQAPPVALSWHAARELAHRLAVPLPVEQAALAGAGGRTLAAPVVAAAMLPTFDNAAMDGYAVRGSGPWRLRDQVDGGPALAGHGVAPALRDGEAVEIATGAPVPAGADRVLRYEDSQRAGTSVREAGNVDGRTHIRRAGEHVLAGQAVLAAGCVLTAAALGLAASVGIDTVTVRRRPRVRILITGDEVVTAGVPPHGKVRDAIGPTMAALLPAWGAQVDAVDAVPDTAPALARAVALARSTVDVTVVCGSSSVGPADHLHRVIHGLGAFVHIDGVACRPGHPQLLAGGAGFAAGSPQERGWIAGLPGNPFAALVAACTIVQPLLAGLAGRALPKLARARLDGALPAGDHHTRLIPVHWEGHQVHAIDGARPGYLGAAARADALAAIAPAPGPRSMVELVPLPFSG